MSNRLGDLISRGEGGYNSYNRGTSNGRIQASNQEIDFSQMSLDELQRRQSLPSSDHQRIFAVGKYQMIPKTLSNAIADLHLSGSERFSASLQERIFADYLIAGKRPAISRYIKGTEGASLHAALKATCQEWASVEDVDNPGKPYGRYGQQGNRATTSASDVAHALNQMRSSYLADINRGSLPAHAWKSVTGQQPISSEIEVAGSGQRRHLPGSELSRLQGLDSKANHLAKKSVTTSELALSLQHALQDLGYPGANGRRLVADGHFGPNTRHAVESFQHAHHLHVDGIAGKHTLAALEQARTSPLLTEATHPQHALYLGVLRGVESLPSQAFAGSEQQRNAAASLTAMAHAGGIRRVDHVVLGSNGVNLFAVQGGLDDPGHRRVCVDRLLASSQTVVQSSEVLKRDHVPDRAVHANLAQQRHATTGALRQEDVGVGF